MHSIMFPVCYSIVDTNDHLFVGVSSSRIFRDRLRYGGTFIFPISLLLLIFSLGLILFP